MLAGNATHIERARHFRKMLGGGWRQAGVLAAAGLHALHNHVERLAEDHEAALDLAAGLDKLGFAVLPPQTNMVWCMPPPQLRGAAFDVAAATLEREDGVRIGGAYSGPAGRQPYGEAAKELRFITHMQTPKATAVRALLGGLKRLVRA